MANGTERATNFRLLLLLLIGALLSIQAAPTDKNTQATAEQLLAEARAQKQEQDVLDVDEDLDARSAYVNNQFVPNEPIDLVDDAENAPLYEILQKQMEQVLAATGPDVPIYEDDKTKRNRLQQPPNKPIFNYNNVAEKDDDYVDEAAPESEQGYTDAEKPDAAAAAEQELPNEGYQAPQLATSSARPTDSVPSFTSTTRSRPQRRRTTTALPKVTKAKISSPSKLTDTTPSSVNHTELASTTAPTTSSPTSHKQRPNSKPNPSNSQLNDPQIYQHKRRIIFKTISTGSQFVNSPIGDLMIKFSIGFAKPAQGVVPPSNEALRVLSNNLQRNIELQKLKRINKVRRD